jgi:hypothetical protein
VTASHCLVAGVTSTIAMLHEEAESIRFLDSVGLPHLLIGQQGQIAGTADLVARRSEARPQPLPFPNARSA